MAQMVLIMGESGTGKSTSIRNCNPATTAVVNPVGKPLPFKGKFTMLNGETDSRKIIKFMKDQISEGKKLIVIDDFQYILSVPYMNRIKESGWDKWNDFGANYFELIDVCKDLPEDVVVAYMTHTETLDNGVTTIKLIGKMLRDKITVEGLFTTVLRTGVNEGKYYFYTQNSGKDTVKSPMGMFPAYAIDNDLNYVADKIRNFYEVGEYKSDDEIAKADAAVAGDVPKPETRRKRGGNIDNIPSEASTEKVPKRTRKERLEDDGITYTESKTVTLTEDVYFHVLADDSYVVKHAGDSVDLIIDDKTIMEPISKEEFDEGVKRLAQQNNPVSDTVDSSDESTTPTQRPRRTRRTRS